MISCRLWLRDAGSTGAATTAADLGGEEELDLLDHLGGVVVGEGDAIFKSAILGRHGQPMVDALHELALIVLREGQHLAQPRGRACRRAHSG